MARCTLCNGRMVKTEYGERCLNSACANATVQEQHGYICPDCGIELTFQRNNAYGDRTYCCPTCKKEITF